MKGCQVVALGGNALIRPGEAGTVEEQAAQVARMAAQLACFPPDAPLVVTHGNGPQVGRVLLRADMCLDEVPGLPLDIAVAATQGEIGIMLQQALGDALGRPVVTVLTQVRVDLADPAFHDPTKYVGRFYTEPEARDRAAWYGWRIKEDPGRGWRRVVASPQPLEVIEFQAIRELLAVGVVVVACGGGGVPVVRAHGRLTSVEAVIDKDRASALLAAALGAERLTVLTGVDEVMVDFGKPSARALGRVRVAELEAWQAQGQFPPGSMGPKVESVLDYLRAMPGGSALITSPECFGEALGGTRGTHVVE